MSNPTYASGNLTREAGAVVEKFHLVRLVDGLLEHNDADSFPYGAVTESAAPDAEREANVLAHGLPRVVRVHTGQTVVPLATTDEFADGDNVYAAADGAVAAAGTVGVGIADRPSSSDGTVRVHLFHPAGLSVAVSDGNGDG